MRLGLLSDTHLPNRTFGAWDAVLDSLRGVDLILHAGDIQAPAVLDSLETVAPVVAALGNNDHGILQHDPRVKPTQVLELEGWRVGLIHDLEPEDRPIQDLMRIHFDRELDLVVSGHTHWERLALRGGVVHVNPGSPNLPRNYSHRLGVVGIIDLTPDSISARIVSLGDLPGLVNPCQSLSLEGERGPLGTTVAGSLDYAPAPVA